MNDKTPNDLSSATLRSITPEPDAELIRLIESVLADAKSGRLRSFIGIGMLDDGSRVTAWSPDKHTVWPLYGAIAATLVEYQLRYVDTPRREPF